MIHLENYSAGKQIKHHLSILIAQMQRLGRVKKNDAGINRLKTRVEFGECVVGGERSFWLLREIDS